MAVQDPVDGAGSVSVEGVGAAGGRIAANIEQVIEGKTAIVRLALAVLLAEGHLLIEDVPGVGKTKLAKALARSIDCSVRRIQFTPDLLPSDVTGVSVYNQETRDFEFKPGAVFANLVVGDEINRASPKTQSALLECMEERQVTVDGITYQLQIAVHGDRDPEPDRDGGHLPAARGAARPVHRPDRDGLPGRGRRDWPCSTTTAAHDPLDDLRRSSDAADGAPADRHGAQRPRRRRGQAVRGRPGHRHPRGPRPAPRRLPPGHPAAAAHRRRVAALEGRDYVLPDDLQALAVPVLAHRIIPTAEAQLARRTTDAIVADVRAPAAGAARPALAVRHPPGRRRTASEALTCGRRCAG